MIERAYIQILGPPGSGKTTLVERLLESGDGWVHVARCVRTERLRRPMEASPPRDPELRRYREAGADGVCRYRFSSRHANEEDFFLTDLMADPSEAVILEGDRPVPYVDLAVFVAPPCPEGGSLLVRRMRDRGLEASQQDDALEKLLAKPDGMDEALRQVLGLELASVLRPSGKATEKLRRDLLEILAKARKSIPPEPTERWAVAEGYEGIQWAPAVVVNVRQPEDRQVAEAMVSDLERIRRDPAVFEDVLRPRGNRIPITAVVADLSDPRDPGTRKILGRVKRSIRSAG